MSLDTVQRYPKEVNADLRCFVILYPHVTTEQYLTVDQVSELLQLNPQTVRRMLAAGTLPGKKLGAREWRVNRKVLEEFLAELKPIPKVKAPLINPLGPPKKAAAKKKG
jgi:excisionase family DNA binding protein